MSGGFDGFWAFSLDRYGREGIAALCLDLQDAHAADVNILLLCLFAAQRGIALSPADLKRVVAGKGGQWHCSVVMPLRAARRAMKHPPPALGPEGVDATRKRLKAVELECERLEQMLLFDELKDRLASDAPDTSDGVDERRRLARAALDDYLAGMDAQGGALLARLVRICID